VIDRSPTWCLFPPQARLVIGSIGQLALLLFCFLAGLEIDLRFVRSKLRPIIVVGLGAVFIPVVVGILIAPLLDSETFRQAGASSTGFALFVGAMLAVSALPVMVRILQEKGLTRSDMGIVAVSSAALTTIALFITASIASSVVSQESAGSIALDVALMVVYLFGGFGLVRLTTIRNASRYEQTQRFTSGLFALTLIVVVVSGLLADVLGLTVVVGGFLSGLAVPHRVVMYQAMYERLGELTAAILLPIFLAYSGLMTDFTLLPTSALGGLGVLLSAAIVSKWGGGTVLARLSGLSWHEANVLGILMNCRGLLVLVIGLVGVQNGIITPVLQLGAVLMALITTMMTGPLFDRYNRRADPVSPERLQAQPSTMRLPERKRVREP
jgi:Kef-type K+ transport system membrane component KefB